MYHSHILVIPDNLLRTSIEMDMVSGALDSSLASLSATITVQVMLASVLLRGEKVSMELLEVEEELMEIRL